MKLKIRVYIEDDEKESFMGIGVLWLLQGIEKFKSIRKAALEMDMSYTKAYKILKNLEIALKAKIFVRQRGGNNREGTTLTEYGIWFLNRYKKLNDEIELISIKEFDSFLVDLNKFSHDKNYNDNYENK